MTTLTTPISCHPYTGALPAWFHAVPERVYAGQRHRPEEDAAQLEELFAQEATRNDLILYTDEHATLRLVGIFPHDQPETAYFGFWETLNDGDLNEAAFAALMTEARRRGYRRVHGPVNFNTFQSYRVRLGQTPGWGQFDREPVNPLYYPALLARLGFAPVLTFESRLIRANVVPDVYADKQQLLAGLENISCDFIPLTPAAWEAHEPEIFELVHAIFSANPGYRAVPATQFRRLYNRAYAERLCPYTSVLFRDRATGRLAALSLCHPNYQPLSLPSRQLPVFERDYPLLPHRLLLAKTVGVHPDFRQRGLMSYLGAYGMVHFREHYEEVIFCLMRSGNYSLRFTNGLPTKTAHYALCGQEL